MNTEERKQIETQIQQDFSDLQKKLEELKTEVQSETDATKKQEKQQTIQQMENELSEMKTLIDTLSSLQEQELQSLKTRIEETKQLYSETRGETVDLLNERMQTPTTYELLKDSETCNRIRNIIASNPKEFKNLPGDTPEKKLEYIFSKIRNSIVLFIKNKLGNSEKHDKIINNTIAPALEYNLLELLRDQGNETNVSMLKRIDKISWDSFSNLVSGVSTFAKKTTGSYDKFNSWVNAIDYLSIHNGVLMHPEKSAVLSNPLEFQAYLNDSLFSSSSFSPYATIDRNIFKVDDSQTFGFGVSLEDKQKILKEVGNIQVVNNPKTTALIASMIDKPEQFLKATSGLQTTANTLLNGLNGISPVAKLLGVDIIGEVAKLPEKRGFLFKIIDFVCKLIGITGGLEGIVRKWRLDRLNLTDEKNDNINEIFGKYRELVGEGSAVSITDETSCKNAFADFGLNGLDKISSTKGDHLRDVMAKNMNISQISPVVVQQILGNNFIKKETEIVNGKKQEKISIDESKFTDDVKKEFAHRHITNMKAHLESNYKDLKDFYTNIKNTDDIAICMTASLYADKSDVIEGIKAKVFLPENYKMKLATVGSSISGGESQSESGEISPYQLSPGEYPFKDVPPYMGISTYDLRGRKMTPVLNYSELTKKHEGVVSLDGSNIKNKGREYPSNDTIGNKNNNPCDISHSSFDIGYVSSGTVADGQKLAKYDSPVNGIASAMRLLRNKYKNMSITEIDVNGYQGYYKVDEEIGLSALRLAWITDQCNALGVGPHQMLNLDDPTTLKSFVAQIAVLETGTHIGQELLDEAYNTAFA